MFAVRHHFVFSLWCFVHLGKKCEAVLRTDTIKSSKSVKQPREKFKIIFEKF